MLLVSDNPYSETTFDGYVAPSFLEVDGARRSAIEVNSLSKSYNMAGCRIGRGRERRRGRGLLAAEDNIDSGMFEAVQLATAAALDRAGRRPR